MSHAPPSANEFPTKDLTMHFAQCSISHVSFIFLYQMKTKTCPHSVCHLCSRNDAFSSGGDFPLMHELSSAQGLPSVGSFQISYTPPVQLTL